MSSWFGWTFKTSPGNSLPSEKKRTREEGRQKEREREAIMTIASGYSQRIRHLSSLESMIYFSTSQKGYVCHRTLKGLLEIAAEAEMEKKECLLVF